MTFAQSFPITEPRCLAQRDGVYCERKPETTCPECLLVSYCGDECRKNHWPAHKSECVVGSFADQFRDGKDAGWTDPTHWAKHGAIDVLNLEKNEGKDYDGPLDLLLLGESSLRHLIYTLVKMPKTAKPEISVTANEISPYHLVRLILCVLLLTDSTHDPIANAETVVHLWYSAKIPYAMFQHMELVAGDLLDTAIADMKGMRDRDEKIEDGDSFPVTMNRKDISVVIDITHAQWSHIIRFIRPSNWTDSSATLFRGIDCKKHTPPLRQMLNRMSRSRAAGMMRWRSDGLLLPYGHPRENFDILNPIFFADHEVYPIGATQEPLMEWPMELLDYPSGPAKNDVYGKMFYYVRDLCVSFQKRLRGQKLEICITARVIEELHLLKKQFDRIEMSDHWDWYPLLTFIEATDLLRHEDENPNATLLTISRDTVSQTTDSIQKDISIERDHFWRPNGTILDEYAPPLTGKESDSRAATRRQLGLLMWRNWDNFLNTPHYLNHLNDDEPSQHRGIGDPAFSGLALKAKNTVARRWPNRLVHSQTAKPSLRDFNRWLGWGLDNKPERWLEWKKVRDVGERAWSHYYKLGLEEKACVGGRLDPKALRESVDKCAETVRNLGPEPEGWTEEAGAEDETSRADEADAKDGAKEEQNMSDATVGREQEPSGDKPKAKKKRNRKKKKKAADA